LNKYVDKTMTYKPSSDFFWPMGSFRKRDDGDAVAYTGLNKTSNGILVLISNCKDQERLVYIEQLRKALPEGVLQIYGHCGLSVPCSDRDESSDCYQNFFRGFKFFLAFENTRCEGYITEKPFRAFEHNMVPIVNGGFGREDYDRLNIPRDAYLHIDDFISISALAEYITEMSESTYNSFFAWRKDYVVEKAGVQDFCQVCDELRKPPDQQKIKGGSFGSSLSSWFNEGTCRR